MILRKRERFLRQTTIRRALVVLRSDTHWLREQLNFGLTRSMVTLEQMEFGCGHKLHPLNRIVRTSRLQTCNRNRFDSLPVYRTSYAVRSAITATAELLVYLKIRWWTSPTVTRPSCAVKEVSFFDVWTDYSDWYEMPRRGSTLKIWTFIYRRLQGNQNSGGLQCEVAYWPALAVGSGAQLAAAHCPKERTLDSQSAAITDPPMPHG